MSHKKLVGLDQQIIKEYLSGISTTILGEKYDASNVTIINILKRNNIDRRSFHDAATKYPYDEHFFDVIDTEEKAYFLGLMYADGYNNTNENYIALTLTDYELVNKFRTTLQTNRPIYESGRTTNNRYIGKDRYEFKVFGKNISLALANKGCYQGKSLTLTFPSNDIVPLNILSHFCRGYFDGDGCIHIRKQRYNKVVHICGTEVFLNKMAEYIPCSTFVNKRHKANIWFLGIYKMADIECFRDWIYKDSTVWLDRKKIKFYTE